MVGKYIGESQLLYKLLAFGSLQVEVMSDMFTEFYILLSIFYVLR